MKSKEIAHLRGLLEAREAELKDLLHHRDGIAIDSNADVLDQMQRAPEREMAIGNLERESVQLREVRGALRRLQAGTFGTCVDCEEKIGMKRLSALPWSALCLACREASERNQGPDRNALEMPLVRPGQAFLAAESKDLRPSAVT